MDYHFGHYVKTILDEVFGKENFVNEISVNRTKKIFAGVKGLNVAFDSLFFYKKSNQVKFRNVGKKGREIKWLSMHSPGIRHPRERQLFGKIFIPPEGRHWTFTQERIDKELLPQNRIRTNSTNPNILEYLQSEIELLDSNWTDIPGYTFKTGYPTENSEPLLERVILSSTNDGDIVADFFVGSGTTPAVAQNLGRKWIACDINLGAIQTTAKRLNQIIQKQQQKKAKDFKGLYAFKIYNVNDYDIFKNELEAKEIVMEMYGVEPIKRSYFDGVLDNNFVKIMPMNRVLNKLDVRTILKEIEKSITAFTVKKKSKAGEPVYEEGVLIIASGLELDTYDFLKKENKTGVKVEIRDILTDKKNLIFKKKPEAKIQVKVEKDKKLSVEIKEFYSPILIRKLEIENEKMLKKEYQAKVEDFRQIIDSVAIDVDYDGKLFNAEITDLPNKKEIIKGKYDWDYTKKGKYTVAVKIVDVLGEEYFETFEVSA